MEESKKRRRGSGEGAIFQRKSDGQWVARITLEGGKRKTLYGKTRKEVADKLRDAQRKVDDGLSLDVDRQTVARFFDKWLAASVKPCVKPKTYITYESLYRTAIAPHIGRQKLAKLSALDLQALYKTLTDSGRSPRTVHHVHRVLHRAFGQAVLWHLIPRNPCDGARAPHVARTEMTVWTPEEADRFLVATREHPMHALYVLALNTGMRQGELLGLRWSDIDWKRGTLSVRRCLQWQRGTGLVFTEPKTARSRRVIHLSQMAMTALLAQHDRQTFEAHSTGRERGDNGLVFCDSQGAPLSPTNETKRFQRATAAAKLPPPPSASMTSATPLPPSC